jgi:hypothetical protein
MALAPLKTNELRLLQAAVCAYERKQACSSPLEDALRMKVVRWSFAVATEDPNIDALDIMRTMGAVLPGLCPNCQKATVGHLGQKRERSNLVGSWLDRDTEEDTSVHVQGINRAHAAELGQGDRPSEHQGWQYLCPHCGHEWTADVEGEQTQWNYYVKQFRLLNRMLPSTEQLPESDVIRYVRLIQHDIRNRQGHAANVRLRDIAAVCDSSARSVARALKPDVIPRFNQAFTLCINLRNVMPLCGPALLVLPTVAAALVKHWQGEVCALFPEPPAPAG